MAIQSTIKNILSKTATAFAIAVVTASAHAAGAAGGLTKASTAADEIKTALFTFMGAAAFIYVMYLMVMAFAEKKQWSDVGMGVVHVAVAGSVLGLVGWAWTLMA
jgi:hypothetical protein